jgi:crossover junction endodeoxyribonuclease RusA
MTDCLQTLRLVMTSPEELRRAQIDLAARWSLELARPVKAPKEHVGGLAGKSRGDRVIELALPFPPSTNTYYRNVGGKMLISAAGRAYRAAVADQVLIQRGAKNLSGRLAVEIVAHVPDKRRRDLDNMLKSALDSLTHAGVWLDDSQIDELAIKRGAVGGMLKVRVMEVLA